MNKFVFSVLGPCGTLGVHVYVDASVLVYVYVYVYVPQSCFVPHTIRVYASQSCLCVCASH